MRVDLVFEGPRGLGARLLLALLIAAATQWIAYAAHLSAPGRGGGAVVLASLVLASRLAGLVPALCALGAHTFALAYTWIAPCGAIAVRSVGDRHWVITMAAVGLAVVVLACPRRRDPLVDLLARNPRRWSRAAVAVALADDGPRRSAAEWRELLDEIDRALLEATRPD